MSKFQERQRQQREKAILATAYTLLTERGYEGMTMDELAAQVGITKVTLYQHFPSKEALAAGIAVDQMQSVEATLRPIYEADGPALERLTAVLRHSLEQQAPSGWLTCRRTLALSLRTPPLRPCMLSTPPVGTARRAG